MLGYVYVMSNEAMPGLYKVGCTSRNPSERASDLYSTGVPAPFVVEYCVHIENYTYIEKAAHSNLSNYNYNKEFFRCDLEKCIIELKRAASAQLPYREWYRDQQMKARIEGREAQYLRELEERRRREQLAREERARREQQEAAAARAEWERKEKERVERDRQRRENEDAGCLWLGGIVLLGLWLGTEERSFWPLVISIIIGFLVYNNFTKNEDSTTTNYHRDTTYMGDYSARNVSPQRTNGTSSQKNVLNSESNAIDVLYPLIMFILCAVGTITILHAFVKE